MRLVSYGELLVSFDLTGSVGQGCLLCWTELLESSDLNCVQDCLIERDRLRRLHHAVDHLLADALSRPVVKVARILVCYPIELL